MHSCKKLCFPTVPVNLVAREFSTQPTRGVLCAVLGVDFETYRQAWESNQELEGIQNTLRKG